MHLMAGEVGLVVFVLKEDFGAFAKDKVWYVVLWMLVGKNALPLQREHALELQLQIPDEQPKLFLQNELAKKEGLGEGVTGE